MEHLPDLLMAYLAKKVMQDCRSGAVPDDKFCQALNNVAGASHFRKLVREEDADWISDLLLNGSVFQRKWVLDITKSIANVDQMRNALLSSWATEDNEVVLQSLIWALLNVDDLPEEEERQIFEWIQTNRDKYIASVANWYGGPDNVLSVLMQRYQTSSYKPVRHWMYLCGALASSDTQGATQFVQLVPDYNRPFINEVRAYVLGQLKGGAVVGAGA